MFVTGAKSWKAYEQLSKISREIWSTEWGIIFWSWTHSAVLPDPTGTALLLLIHKAKLTLISWLTEWPNLDKNPIILSLIFLNLSPQGTKEEEKSTKGRGPISQVTWNRVQQGSYPKSLKNSQLSSPRGSSHSIVLPQYCELWPQVLRNGVFENTDLI